MKIAELSQMEREVFLFIWEKVESRGHGPTIREIGEALEIQTPNAVLSHLKVLVKNGLITERRQAESGCPR